jgi:putative ABC transport system substrate-binding protein
LVPLASLSLAGQEHGRTIPLADVARIIQRKLQPGRSFLGFLIALSFSSSAANSQNDRARRIAIVMNYPGGDPIGQARFASTIESLHALGWIEGRNLSVEARGPGADLKSIQKEIDDLAKVPWDVVVATSTPITRALLLSDIGAPIVFTNVSDPVGDGFVESLARPGRNVTGFINYEGPLAGKWLQLLKQIYLRMDKASLLFNPDVAPRHGDYYWVAFEAAVRSLGIMPTAAPVRIVGDIDEAMQNFIHHLAPPNGKGGGIAAFVMANGSLSSTTGGVIVGSLLK